MTFGPPSNPEAVLSHYGVLGMKWGVRKDDPSAGGTRATERRKERKQSAKSLQEYMWNAVKDEPVFGKTMSEQEYKNLSRRGHSYVEGTTLRRISMGDKPETELKGHAFVSRLQADSTFYKAVLPAVGPQAKGMGGGKKKYKVPSYELTLKTHKKLTAPSEKERVDAFMEILKTPSIKVPGKDAPISGRQFLQKNYPFMKKKSDEEFGREVWYDFLNTHGNKDSPLAKAYFDNIKKRGYNAIIDDNDKNRYTKAPLILLDSEGTVRVTNVKRLTPDDINRAQRQLTASRR